MTRTSRLIAALLIALGLGVLAWKAWDQTSPPVVRLADGSWLELRGVTVGTNDTFQYGPLWRRMAAWIPGGLGRKFGSKATVSTYASSPTNVTFWFVRRGAPLQTNTTTAITLKSSPVLVRTGQIVKRTPKPPVVSAVPCDGLKVNLRDEDGQGEPGFHKFRTAALANHEEAFYWSTPTAPTGSARLKLCVYRFSDGEARHILGSDGKRFGEIFLPNPLYRKEP
jgi:hypothetical protein